MSDGLFEHVVLPVASVEDAETTARAAKEYVTAAGGRVTVVNVIEKAGGAPDKASVEQREQLAEDAFEATRAVFSDVDVTVETDVEYGTDVSESILRAAAEVDATAIAFVPRGGSRWIRLLTGDTALDLITENDRPVISLPDPDREGDADEGSENVPEDADDEDAGDDDPEATDE